MDRIIIDGYGLAYRSHYGFSDMVTTNGLYSGCLYGFVVAVRSLKNRFPSFHITVAWDNYARRKFELFTDYKKDRSQSFDIGERVSQIKDLLSHLGVDQADKDGEEADDVIATLVRQYEHEDGQIYIYTRDKDLMQLVKDGKVVVVRPKYGSSPEKFFDEEAVFEKFSVYPRNLAVYLALRGDKIDGIPGVPKVPGSILAGLIEKYREPRKIYASLDNEDMTPFQRETIKKCEEQIYVNHQLTLLKDDLEDMNVVVGASDVDAVTEIFEKFEIRSVKPESFVDMFGDESSFPTRRAPAVSTFSLF